MRKTKDGFVWTEKNGAEHSDNGINQSFISNVLFQIMTFVILCFSTSRHGTKTDIVNWVMVLEERTNSSILIVQTAHCLIQSYVCDSFPALIFVVCLR